MSDEYYLKMVHVAEGQLAQFFKYGKKAACNPALRYEMLDKLLLVGGHFPDRGELDRYLKREMGVDVETFENMGDILRHIKLAEQAMWVLESALYEVIFAIGDDHRGEMIDPFKNHLANMCAELRTTQYPLPKAAAEPATDSL